MDQVRIASALARGIYNRLCLSSLSERVARKTCPSGYELSESGQSCYNPKTKETTKPTDVRKKKFDAPSKPSESGRMRKKEFEPGGKKEEKKPTFKVQKPNKKVEEHRKKKLQEKMDKAKNVIKMKVEKETSKFMVDPKEKFKYKKVAQSLLRLARELVREVV